MQRQRPGMMGRGSGQRGAVAPTPITRMNDHALFRSRPLLARERHPHGVRPMGNAFMDRPRASPSPSPSPSSLSPSLSSARGSAPRRGPCPFDAWPDAMLINWLAQLPAASVAQLAGLSRRMYCFAYHDALWRGFVAQDFGGSWSTFRSTWRNTYKALALERRQPPRLSPEAPVPPPDAETAPPPSALVMDVPIRCDGVFSDVLYLSWRNAHLDLHVVCSGGGGTRQPLPETIPRVRLASCVVSGEEEDAAHDEATSARQGPLLSDAAFTQQYMEGPDGIGAPVILTNVVTTWPIYRTWPAAEQRWQAATFQAESVRTTYAAYQSYAAQTHDESPLYLFDKDMHHATDVATFPVPAVFSEDWFHVLGPAGRPDFRWLIVGPARAGSTFHIDPNATSAWNAVITGRKRWILFPPGVTPPGVYPSEDGGEVTTPECIVDWWISYLPIARAQAMPFVEGTCAAGEMIFVPSGWWHAVINLDASVAITQNFVATANLPQVLAFTEHRPDHISGLQTTRPAAAPPAAADAAADGELGDCCAADQRAFYGRFVAALEREAPAVLADAQDRRARLGLRVAKRRRGADSAGDADDAAADASDDDHGSTIVPDAASDRGGGDSDRWAKRACGSTPTGTAPSLSSFQSALSTTAETSTAGGFSFGFSFADSDAGSDAGSN